jgi:hypothetical protein
MHYDICYLTVSSLFIYLHIYLFTYLFVSDSIVFDDHFFIHGCCTLYESLIHEWMNKLLALQEGLYLLELASYLVS